MNRTVVVMPAPFQVGACREEFLPPGPGEVAVECRLSAISAGTELLFYRGQVPQDLPLDAGLSSLAGTAGYPLRYGYAAVGRVIALGPEADRDYMGQRVFCFHPHASHIAIKTTDIAIVPNDVDDRDALFLATMETAVTLMLDARPAVGEKVTVLGQGVVGLLAAALLARHPLQLLFTVDPILRRRQASLDMGAHAAFGPQEMERLVAGLGSGAGEDGADLVFELSSDPTTLNLAINLTGFGGRVVIGSWYGTKSAAVDLGGRFHRSRIRLIASQVSTLPTIFLARWDRTRRLETAWEMLRRIRPSRLITHELPVERAPEAYELLDRRPDQALQVVLAYGH
jgi:2-desacetyl-2-hydroxyethyl bacteriochlorophyllide A dehydrogenase